MAAITALSTILASILICVRCEDFFGADSLPEAQRALVYQALIYGAVAVIGILIVGILITICVWAYIRHKASIHPIGIALPTHKYYQALDNKYYNDENERGVNDSTIPLPARGQGTNRNN